MPYLLKSLKPVWGQWELLGTALKIPLTNIQVASCRPEDNLLQLLNIIKKFGATTPFEEHTWKKIYEAATDLDRMDIANRIKEDHNNLTETCESIITCLKLP